MDCSTIGRKLREHLGKFMGKVFPHFSKPQRRFVAEMLYGIQASKDIKLSSIARRLEEPISLLKVENRLSRQLAREGLDAQLRHALLADAAPRIAQDTLLLLDLSDIRKPYARAMEYMAHVRDGSSGEIANGYWLLQVIGCEAEKHRFVPVWQELYSAKSPGFISENEQIIDAIATVSAATEGRGIWVIDRGGDRDVILTRLLDKQQRFIICQRGDRHLCHKHKVAAAITLAKQCPVQHIRGDIAPHPGG